MEFQFKINLRRMALLASGLSLWNKDDIQYKLKQYLYPYGRKGKEKFLKQLISEVIKKVDRKLLPDILYCELILVIKELGYKMNNWFYYLKRRKVFRDQSRRQIYDKYFKNIYWTHYGRINEERIFRNFWLNAPNVDLIKMYIIACCYCMEDVIENLWGKISLYDTVRYNQLCARLGYHLVVYWNKRRENDLEGFFNDIILPYSGDSDTLYDMNESAEVNMLRLSVRKGYTSAVVFFWNKISDLERSENIVFCLSCALNKYYEIYWAEFYRIEQYAEIAFFLMKFLPEEKKKEIFEDSETFDFYSDREYPSGKRRLRVILKMGIFLWPWQEFFPDIFKKVENFLDEGQYKSLIRNIIREIDINDKFGVPAQRSISDRQLHQAWASVPSNLKAKISTKIFFDMLFKSWCLSSIKLILNDRYIVKERQNIIKNNYLNVISLVEDGKCQYLYEFINEILISPEWDLKLQESIKSLYGVILKGELDLANGIILNYSEEEKRSIKQKIHHKFLCYYFIIKEQYDMADKLLQWKLEDLEKIEKYKSSFEKDDFTIKRISKFWETPKENVETAKAKSHNFLLWFLGDEISVLRYKLKFVSLAMFERPEYTVYFNWRKYVNDFEILDDFLSWCSFTPENIQIAKRTIVKEDIGLTDILQGCMKENRLDRAEALLKWAFESPAERSEFMRSFLLSKKGINACQLYIGKYISLNVFEPKGKREEIVEKFNKFISFFIKPYLDNFYDLKSALKDWPIISKIQHEIIASDEPSTEEIFSEGGDLEYENTAYCDDSNYNLFLSLLDSVNSKSND